MKTLRAPYVLYVLLVYVLLAPLLGACLVGSGPLDSPALEDCADDFEARALEVLRSRHIEAVSLFLPSGMAREQLDAWPQSICPELALERAVDALLSLRGLESLVDIAGDPAQALDFFDRESSLFGMVADRDRHAAHRFLPAIEEFSTEDHWVFFLSVPDLGEHGYWAAVPRTGGAAAVVGKN